MAGNETPLAAMKRIYGSKDKLVEAAVKALAELGEEADAVRERLRTSSNQKLMRLVDVAGEIKKGWGNRDKLVKAVVEAVGKAKDSDFVARVEALPLPRLLDLARSSRRRGKPAGQKKKAAA